jgi:dienelactone hydrolase
MKKLSLPALIGALIIIAVVPAGAEMKTQTVAYGTSSAPLEGYLAYDDSSREPRPGILVIHEWWGLNDYIRSRAEQLAKLGYVAFAADIYGKGLRASTQEQAKKLSGQFGKDRKLLRSRAQAALDQLLKNPLVDKSRVAAIGYCFGGMTALELARSGAPLKAVVSFHGTLNTSNPEDARNIKGSILALTGADDPFVPAKQRESFVDEMRKGNVDYQLHIYGNTVHSFTNPASGSDPSKGIAYNPLSDRRSWQAMQDLFNEVFKK